MKHVLIFVAALLAAGVAAAQTDPRLAQLEAVYNRVHQEQQAAYQQFQMAQELRRAELREQVPIPNQNYTMGGELPDYDRNVRLQRERQERLQRYDRDIADAYARYQELGSRKQALLDQMLELSQPPRR